MNLGPDELRSRRGSMLGLERARQADQPIELLEHVPTCEATDLQRDLERSDAAWMKLVGLSLPSTQKAQDDLGERELIKLCGSRRHLSILAAFVRQPDNKRR